jgi:hypothetical protein
MNLYTKAVLSIIRLIASALFIISFFLYSSDAYVFLQNKTLPRPGFLVLKGIPLLVGLPLFVRGRALAEYFTKDLD